VRSFRQYISEASYGHTLWIDPKGKVYDMGNVANNTHFQWVSNNWSKYFGRGKIDDKGNASDGGNVYDTPMQKGWARVRNHNSDISVQVDFRKLNRSQKKSLKDIVDGGGRRKLDRPMYVDNWKKNKTSRAGDKAYNDYEEISDFLSESIIDIPRKNYSSSIFDGANTNEPKLKKSVKQHIEKALKPFHEMAPIITYKLIGSILTKQYRKDADLDVNILFNIPKGERESKLVKLRKMVSKVNGENIPGTSHPLNFYVIVDEATHKKANEMADNVYDIQSDSFDKRSEEKEFDVDDYMKDFSKKVEKIDIVKGELSRDLIDFKELDELDKEDIENLEGRVKEKIKEIESDLKILIQIGKDIWKDRQSEFKKDMSPDEIRKYGTHNRLPKNVIYKMLEKYYYIQLMHDLEDVLGDDKKLSRSEVDKIKDAMS
tara:strand:+ start:735 stop:2024 length:1290 start_codon:yes stop_codon:yes gene_type:complete